MCVVLISRKARSRPTRWRCGARRGNSGPKTRTADTRLTCRDSGRVLSCAVHKRERLARRRPLQKKKTAPPFSLVARPTAWRHSAHTVSLLTPRTPTFSLPEFPTLPFFFFYPPFSFWPSFQQLLLPPFSLCSILVPSPSPSLGVLTFYHIYSTRTL